jgi:XisH protein
MAKDIFHNNARIALEKDGWLITAEQLRIDLNESYVEIDLMAESLLAAERAGERIAVEVKSFLGKSLMSEWHTALGQFLDYRDALEEAEPGRVLYLGLPIDAYNDKVFQGNFIQRRIAREQVKLIVFDPESNIIVLWKS